MAKDRSKRRIAIVEAAARRCGCSVNEIFIRAQKGLRKVVTDLKKIPERVIRYARRVLKQHFDKREKKRRQKYFRVAPFMLAC
ncbi:MAG: hypothetical protein Q8L30_02485 [bacterium]|nr:hypothetical protein [bacterium]